MSASSEKLVLALNAGSSSLKSSVIRNEETLVSFLAERLTTPKASIRIKSSENSSDEVIHPDDKENGTFDHATALHKIIEYIKEKDMLKNLVGVGHRVVHGGTIFSDSARITDETLEQIESVSHLAPLHNPHNVAGIKVMRDLLPDLPNVAVFDTSFHSSIPVKAFTYPLPKEYRDRDMRKFGFHGTSVRYVAEKANQTLRMAKDKKAENDSRPFQLIVCHLGNGASVTAVSGNKSMDTSMGFTPLSGLMMGTRCGDVDPSLVSFAVHQMDKDVDEVLNDFNKRSGLKGMIGDGENDMRVLLKRAKDGDHEAKLAVDMFVYHLSQHVAQYLVSLEGPLDAIVFTAGIGEHSAEIRLRTIDQLSKIIPNLQLDENRNKCDGSSSDGIISKDGIWPAILDIATDEEAMIANECIRLAANSCS